MDWLDSLQSKGLSEAFSNTTVQKHPFFGAQLFHSNLSYTHFPKCCLTSSSLSSLLPLTHELLQNPNLNYLFQTLNLTHTLLNASNTQLAKDCWICLSVTPLGDSALSTSILNWTTGNMSLHHSYHGEPLVISYLKYLHTSDQI